MRQLFVSSLVVFFYVITTLPSAAKSCGHDLGRPSVGLVLSGGGARGAAHVGVIKVLEQLNIPVDCISGTSMGAIVGGLYASGMTATELEEVLLGLDWADALTDSTSRQDLSFRRKQDDINFLIDFDIGFRGGKVRLPKGLVQGQKLSLLLRKLTQPVEGIKSFDDLPIPFRAVATDIESGNMIVMGRGDLVTAIKASMSAPGVFAPVERDGKLLIDGGVANNLPVDVIRAMGADVLIVVDIGFPLLSREELTSAISMTNQMLTILIRRKSDQQLNTLKGRDVALLPELGDIGSTDFHRSDEAVPLGEAAAYAKRERLSELSLSHSAYATYEANRLEKRDFSTRKVRNITIEDNSQWSKRVLNGSLQTHPGQILAADGLHKDISKLYGLDTFESVDYQIEHVDDQYADVTIRSLKKDWGPNFVNLGINLIDDFSGSSGYNLAMRYTKTQVNPLGAEWRSDVQIGDQPLFTSEFYQPLNYASKYFVAPSISLSKESVFQYDTEGDILAEFRLGLAELSLDIGQTIGQNSEVRVGISRAKGSLKKHIGAADIDDRVKFDSAAYRFRYSYDRRDNVRFTRSGNVASLQWDGFRKGLGDDSNNDRLSYNAAFTKSWGDNTYVLFSRGGTNLNADGQIEDLFDVGGLFNLSGFGDRELRGQHALLFGLAYYRHIGLGSSTFETPLYVGATIEGGNVWDNSDDIGLNDLIPAGSLFVGLDTFVGPLYLAYGLGEGGRSATYFRLGQLFE